VKEMHIRMMVNGASVERDVEPCVALADFLRDSLGLTGTHLGCEHGVCGSCTILLDGVPVRSCLMLAVQADGCELTTVEGLGSPGNLHPLQRAFAEAHALQCGFCTSGLLMTAYALLQENSAPTRQEVREAIAGNLCRCTGYNGIVEAIVRGASS
jgi:aerobic-type carbon monoxide dehydrogenase small subunit (CoxS/CutS family)